MAGGNSKEKASQLQILQQRRKFDMKKKITIFILYSIMIAVTVSMLGFVFTVVQYNKHEAVYQDGSKK